MFLPGGRHAAVGTKGGQVELVDVAAGEVVARVDAHEGPVWSVCLTPDRSGDGARVGTVPSQGRERSCNCGSGVACRVPDGERGQGRQGVGAGGGGGGRAGAARVPPHAHPAAVRRRAVRAVLPGRTPGGLRSPGRHGQGLLPRHLQVLPLAGEEVPMRPASVASPVRGDFDSKGRAPRPRSTGTSSPCCAWTSPATRRSSCPGPPTRACAFGASTLGTATARSARTATA